MKSSDWVQKFETGLEKLTREIEQYSDERALWTTQPGINNSAGNLCLHLLGNLNHYIGAGMGNTGYVRNRPAEFSDGGISKNELLNRIVDTTTTVRTAIENLNDEKLLAVYAGGDSGSERVTIEAELLNILTHFNYHLGQINYHRRLTAQ